MAGKRSSDDSEGGRATADSRRYSRRGALGLLGSGLVAGSIGTAGADEHEAEVRDEGGTWYAEAHGSQVYSGGNLFDAIQSAVDGLTSGRRSNETVVVRDSGTAETSGNIGVELPSYTTLDVRGTITLTDSGTIPIYADNVESIEIPTYSLEGSPGMGMRIRRATDVRIGDVTMDIDTGIGIRIDNAYNDGTPVTTERVRIDSVTITGSDSHAVETYGVDDIEIGTVETRDTGGCGLLLNDTSNATVGLVDATRANEGGGYAGFRCANGAGPNISVEEVRAVDCGRGVFTVSGSHGITIDEVDIDGCGSNLIQDSRDVEVNGGTVEDNAGEGFRIDSRDDGRHPHTRDVTIQNVGIYGNDYGILETGPDTENNAILDNDLCDNGTDIETYASSTTVSGNTSCEGSPDDGDDGETDIDGEPAEISSGTYRLRNVNSGHFLEVADGSTEDGATVQQGSDNGHETQQWDVEEVDTDEYVFTNVNSGKALDVYERGTDDGDDVIQWEPTGDPNQRFTIVDTGGGECLVVNVNSGKALDVYERGTDDGDNVVQWEPHGDPNQLWTFETVEESDGEDGNNEDDDGDQDGPRDLDGDGLYRDVDGNGEFGVNDVVTLFEDVDEPYIADNPDRFDFTGNGQVSTSDVVELFEQL